MRCVSSWQGRFLSRRRRVPEATALPGEGTTFQRLVWCEHASKDRSPRGAKPRDFSSRFNLQTVNSEPLVLCRGRASVSCAACTTTQSAAYSGTTWVSARLARQSHFLGAAPAPCQNSGIHCFWKFFARIACESYAFRELT
jgi:hypothetical protein